VGQSILSQRRTLVISATLRGGRLAKGKTVNIPLPGDGDRQSLTWLSSAATQRNFAMSHGARGRVFFSTRRTDSLESVQPEIGTLILQNTAVPAVSRALCVALEKQSDAI
jgi:hypothetical protein